MNHLFKKGAVVNIFQMSFNDGLLFEGKATVVKPVGSGSDEHYMVRFHTDIGKYNGPTPTYERFIDREGQADPDAYIKAFNKKLGIKAA
jgi:hypothetical protein